MIWSRFMCRAYYLPLEYFLLRCQTQKSVFFLTYITCLGDNLINLCPGQIGIIARTCKQPRCPSTDEWIRKLWYICTMEYYSVIKKNAFESVLMRWMKLEPILQSEVSQKEKHQYSILMHIYGI